jgi:hypothetical protein
MNLTMRNTFLLLALFLGAVRGTHIDAEVQGVKLDENYCTPSVYDELYAECVVTTAEALGVVFDRRLELRGSRGLQYSCSVCPPNPPKGHWCWVKCGYATRRLEEKETKEERKEAKELERKESKEAKEEENEAKELEKIEANEAKEEEREAKKLERKEAKEAKEEEKAAKELEKKEANEAKEEENEKDNDRRLTTQSAIQAAATECYGVKAAMPEYDCLGAAEDLDITIIYNGE